MTARPIVKGISQMGLYVPDPSALAEFHRKVLGLQIAGQSEINAVGVAYPQLHGHPIDLT